MRCYMGQFVVMKTADLQDDLCRLEDWQQKKQMEFTPSKCKITCFSTRRDPPKREYVFCGEILEGVECHPYLGVVLDNKMRWSPHIETITSKANKVLGLIKRNLWNCPKSVKETAYKTLVRPKLQYACSAWDPHYQKDKAALERLSTIYKMCYGLLDGDWGDYLITSRERRTRGSHDFKFIVPKGHKDIFRFSFFPRTITEWNKLPEETVSSQSLSVFLKVN